MDNNQKGFSVVELLVIVVVIGLIGGVSWYVWQSRNEPQPSTTSQTTQADKQSEVSKSNSKEKYIEVGTHKVFYTPPEGWTVEERPVTTIGNDASGGITLYSSDYRLDNTDEECGTTLSGTAIGINFYSTEDNNDKFINNVLSPSPDSPEAQLTKDAKQVTLAGQKAVQYSSSPGECGWSLATAAVFNKYAISVGTSLDDYSSGTASISDANKAIYSALVGSIRYE